MNINTKHLSKLLFVLSLSLSSVVSAFDNKFTLVSHDITEGKFMTDKQEFNGFGCSGADLSPHLAWKNVPEGTKSFALTVYDPDAPTGSGWWHWQIVNIPRSAIELKVGAGSAKESLAPSGSVQVKNDYGIEGFGGACPPKGHGVHRYQFTVHALSVATLALPDDPSSALVGYMINANSIASSTIEALYEKE